MNTGDQMIGSILLAPSTPSAPLIQSAPAGEFAEVFERVQHETAPQEARTREAFAQEASPQETAAVQPSDAATSNSITEDTDEPGDTASTTSVSVLVAPTPPPPSQTLVATLKALTNSEPSPIDVAVQPATSAHAALSVNPTAGALDGVIAAEADGISDLAPLTSTTQSPIAEQSSPAPAPAPAPSPASAPAAAFDQDLELLSSSSSAAGTALEGEATIVPAAETSERTALLDTTASASLPTSAELEAATEQALQVSTALGSDDSATTDAKTVQTQPPTSEQKPATQPPNATPQASPAQTVSEASPRALQAPVADLVRNEVWEIAKRASLVAPRSIEASVLTEHGPLAITARHAATGVQVTLSGDAASALDLPALHLELAGSGIDVSVGTPKQRAEEADTRTFTATAQNPAAAIPRPLSQRSPSSISQLDVLA
jgi:hypothetical protein